jgi:predicted trehalose synthase
VWQSIYSKPWLHEKGSYKVNFIQLGTEDVAALSSKDLCPLGTLVFSDDDTEEDKDELSSELVVTLKQRIAALGEQVTELHLAVYDQKDDFGMLRKATTSKLKWFAKALGDPSLYNAPPPYGA